MKPGLLIRPAKITTKELFARLWIRVSKFVTVLLISMTVMTWFQPAPILRPYPLMAVSVLMFSYRMCRTI